MRQKEALTVLVRRHQAEFNDSVNYLVKETGSARRKAKIEVVKRLATKYQKEYVSLRGKDLKGRL